MYFKQFYLESLGHASYLVGDERTGKALVLDARRDVDAYFETARSKDLQVAYAVDTHGHNDYLSGIMEVSHRQKVQRWAYAEAEVGYEHRAVKDGELIEMGDVGFEVLHTPGHTPEHISLVVYDREVGDEPVLMLSGGALLVGDLARPDLLGGEEEARAAARVFCHTIQEKLLGGLPDHLEVFPTHVAGSLCGGNIGSRLSTTLGLERKTNEVLNKVSSSDEFVEECIRLDDLPAVPPYWRRMRAQNMAGPDLLGVLGEPPALRSEEFAAMQTDGAVVVDARSLEAYAGAHIPGSLNVGLGSSFPTWVGTVLPEDARVLLVLDDPSDLWDATWGLLRIGYSPPVGWLAGGMQGWRTGGNDLSTATVWTVQKLHERLRDVHVLDVRQPAEWGEGHIRDARFITGAELPARLDEVPDDKPVAVVCGSGYRSSVAASLLRRAGHERVINVLGGMSAWNSAGLPTT